MINRKLISVPCAVVLAAAPLLLFIGCSKQEPGAPVATDNAATGSSTRKTASSVKSAEKTSFDEVTAQLDPGGNFYLYWGTEKLLSDLASKLSSLQELVMQLPEINPEQRDMIGKGFEVGLRLIKESGIQEISGLGISSIAVEKGLYRNKAFLHHERGKNSGLLWSLFGQKPHALPVDLLPASTVLASFSDLDLGRLWSMVTNQLVQAGFPPAQEALQMFPAQFQAMTGLEFGQVLRSMGGEFGVIVTLDETRMLPIPVGDQTVQLPEPGVMFLTKVKDDTIFDRIEQLLSGNQQMPVQVVKVDKPNLKMRTIQLPIPIPLPLRPTLARAGEYLILSTSDTLVEELAAVKSGEKKGWKASDEYKKLSDGLPQQGNQFVFFSQRFGRTIMEIQKQVLKNNPQMQNLGPGTMEKLFALGEPMSGLTVSGNADDGWHSVSKSNKESSQALLATVVVVPAAMLAGIAIPNFVKARGTAQRNVIMNNLRQLQGAKEQWALENKKKDGDPVDENAVYQFIRGGRLNPVQGEIYELNPVGRSPVAKLPDGSTIAAE